MITTQFLRPLMLGAGLIFAMGTLSACDEEGPAEELGESIDKTVKKSKEAVEDAVKR